MTYLFHITTESDWAAAAATPYVAPSLASEGFIHCSLAGQLLPVADERYAGQAGLVLLAIDPRRLNVPVVYEDCYDTGQAFPHIYGAIPHEAVTAVYPFPVDGNGRFSLPLRLQVDLDQPVFDLGGGREVRLLESHHAGTLFRLLDSNRNHLRRWLPWVDANRTVADSKRFIADSLAAYQEKRGFSAGIWDGEDLAGVIGLHPPNWTHRHVSLGYWLGASYQGRGLVTAAVRALVDYCFDELALHRVEIQCATDNERSCAIPMRLGFQHEGVLRQIEWLNDQYVDHNVYGLLVGERPLAPV